MKKILALLLCAVMVFSLAACGGSSEESAAPESTAPESSAPESTAPDGESAAIPGLEDGVFTVGMECAYAPYNWMQMDDSNGAVPISNVPGSYANGYDVMIAKKICEANGWELEIVSST